MRNVILFMLLVIMLVSCSENDPVDNASRAILETGVVVSFVPVCDPGVRVGMWAYTENMGDEQGGYAVRMTDEEYERWCVDGQ